VNTNTYIQFLHTSNSIVLDTARVFPPQNLDAMVRGVAFSCEKGLVTGTMSSVEYSRNSWKHDIVNQLESFIGALSASGDISWGGYASIPMHFSGIGSGLVVFRSIHLPDGKEAADFPDIVNVAASKLFNTMVLGPCVWIDRPKGEFLYKMLRPEFVASYKTALSSDAFSAFGRHGHVEHNAEVS